MSAQPATVGQLADGPMPDLSYLAQCPTRRDFAAAIADQIVDDALPDRATLAEDGYAHAQRNALALMHAALYIAGRVVDDYPGQDLTDMAVFERWSLAKSSLRKLQRMRAVQLGAGVDLRRAG